MLRQSYLDLIIIVCHSHSNFKKKMSSGDLYVFPYKSHVSASKLLLFIRYFVQIFRFYPPYRVFYTTFRTNALIAAAQAYLYTKFRTNIRSSTQIPQYLIASPALYTKFCTILPYPLTSPVHSFREHYQIAIPIRDIKTAVIVGRWFLYSNLLGAWNELIRCPPFCGSRVFPLLVPTHFSF